jgi:hypothetical protein
MKGVSLEKWFELLWWPCRSLADRHLDYLLVPMGEHLFEWLMSAFRFRVGRVACGA